MDWGIAFAAALLVGTLGVHPARAADDRVAQVAEVPIAMDFLAALGRQDFGTAGLFLDEDAVLDLPYAGEGLTVRGRDEILGFFRKSMAGSTAEVIYSLNRAYPSPEAGAVVLEVSTRARTAAGREYTNRLVTIFEIRRDKIVLFREYFNPTPLNR